MGLVIISGLLYYFYIHYVNTNYIVRFVKYHLTGFWCIALHMKDNEYVNIAFKMYVKLIRKIIEYLYIIN